MSPNHRRKVFYTAFLVFVLSFAVRIGVSSIYTHYYDTYEDRSLEATLAKMHAMVKGDAEAVYYRPANVIIQQVRSGQSFFFAGGWHIGGFLYPRLIALYGLTTGKITLNADGTIPTKQIYGFLVIQSLLFSLCLILFFLSLTRVVGFTIGSLSAAFLAMEPTLVQYSAMIMTEILFVAFLLLAISTWVATFEIGLDEEPLKFRGLFILLGVLLGFIYLQRDIAILLPAVFVVGIYAQSGWKFNKPFLTACTLMVVPYVVVVLLVGVHNYGRAGLFYIIPVHGPYGWHAYLANHVIAEVKQSSPEKERIDLNRKALLRAIKEGVVRNNVTEDELNEYEFSRLSYIKQDEAKNIFLEHPWITVRIAVRNTLKSLHIDPLFTYRRFDNVYKPESAELRAIQKARHTRDIPLRIAYSLLVLVPAFLGWLFWRRALPLPLNVLLTLSIVYFPAVSGWMGSNRYNVPNLGFYAIYWAISLERLITWVKGRTLAP